ncbi:MAG: DCC1-like thiol-disulfide oxidoreductase family protein [Trueperaceae bacterium]
MDRVPVLLFDGHCRFCTDQAQRLERLAGYRVRPLSFQDEGTLTAFPGLSHSDCMKEMKLIDADGSIYGGAPAAARALALGRPHLAWLFELIYLPGVKQIANAAYRWVARNRYRFPGGKCDDEGCELHRRT